MKEIIEHELWIIIKSEYISEHEKIKQIFEIFSNFGSQHDKSLWNRYKRPEGIGFPSLREETIRHELDRVMRTRYTNEYNKVEIFKEQIDLIVFLLKIKEDLKITRPLFFSQPKEKITVEYKELNIFIRTWNKGKKMISL